MSELRIETWTMPAADLGPENPLPALKTNPDMHAMEDAKGIPDEMLRNIAYGHLPNTLPYTMQDGYNRQLAPRAFRVAVLENDLLRATFQLELGGRLWSLVDKRTGRELLEVNPIFQPANLALRNAWFSGGVEWNISTIGHSPFTCSPVFAAHVQSPDGQPILRLYEWERMRQVPFQIDVVLPDGSPVLFVYVRITNPHDHTIPMYWWSNIAVPETHHTRVITPADSTYRFDYGEGLQVIPLPEVDGIDYTYATNSNRSVDYFFDVPDDVRPWIAALDGAGKGLMQTSTARLRGRKLFVWGMGNGGRTWQSFLSEPDRAYIEIQAGLARTQLEHLPMPAHAAWSWVEAYGLLEVDPAVGHHSDWATARRGVNSAIEDRIPRPVLAAQYARCEAWADIAPVALLQRGAGWGALERKRREVQGQPPFCSAGLVFDDASLSDAQTPWITLLETGAFPEADPKSPPGGIMVQAEWRTMLESRLKYDPESGWLAWCHLGVMAAYAGDSAAARQAWEQSLLQAKTPWVMRNLAVDAWQRQDMAMAHQWILDAYRMQPSLRPLAVECGQILIEAGHPQAWRDLLSEAPEQVRTAGRIRLLEAQAALLLGDLPLVEAFFADEVIVDDMRESEVSLAELWFAYHEQRLSAVENAPIDPAMRSRVRREYPLPAMFDFRMT